MHRRLPKALLAVAAIPLVAAACTSRVGSGGSSGSAPSPHYPVGTMAEAIASVAVPGSAAQPPPGADVRGCRPSAAHRYPVVLVHGTGANQHMDWLEMAPVLANAGYCVYTFNYGADANTHGTFYGLGGIAASASQLQVEVQAVLRETGARRVDIVGYSQGGMMPRYYIDDLGGARHVHLLVGLAPSNYGTTANGLLTLVRDLGLSGAVDDVASAVGEALVEQEEGSAFLTALDRMPTEPAVTYVVIESEDDEIVTPYTNSLLPPAPNVQDVIVQDQCPDDRVGHLAMPFDGVVIQDVLNALGDDSRAFRPTCTSSAYGAGI